MATRLHIGVECPSNCTSVILTTSSGGSSSVSSGYVAEGEIEDPASFTAEVICPSGVTFDHWACGVGSSRLSNAITAAEDPTSPDYWEHGNNPTDSTTVSWVDVNHDKGNTTYIYLIPVVSTGPSVGAFAWSAEALAAFTGNGAFSELTAAEWSDMVAKVDEVVTAAGLSWSSYTYTDSDTGITYYANVSKDNMDQNHLSSGDTLTAAMYNSVIWNISKAYYTLTNGTWYYANTDLRKPGDPVLGSYFAGATASAKAIDNGINACIDLL